MSYTHCTKGGPGRVSQITSTKSNSIIVGTEKFPLIPQKMQLMEHYVKAFHKVFENIEEVLEIDLEKYKRTVPPGRAEEL